MPDSGRGHAAGVTQILKARYDPPAGWSRRTCPDATVYKAPEGDLSLAIVDLAEADDGGLATARARAIAGMTPDLAVRVAVDEPPRQGWDRMRATLYEHPPGRKAWTQAVACGCVQGWTVVVAEGAMATFEKRAASIMQVLQSLRAPGFQPEDVSAVPPRPMDQAMVEALLAFLREAMQKLDIPGVGLALVAGQRILFEGGLGVRSVDTGDPVDADTLFPIASNTKGMTTLLLASLVDEGRLQWDDVASHVYPGFRLGDRSLTDKVQIRHLVSAATGLPRKDLVWSFTNRADTPAARIFEMLADDTPTSGFGEVYQYNNLMAAAAGFIGGHVAYPEGDPGAGFDRALEERVFRPLGMHSTTFDRGRVASGNHADLHGQDAEGKTVAVDLRITTANYASRPSGGAWSSAHDMARYVRLEVMEGRLPDGAQLITRANLLARRAPGVSMGAQAHYGMGLVADREAGVSVIHHGGSTPGGMSDIFILPDAGVGAVLLTNSDSGMFLLPAFKRRLVELLYGAQPMASDQVDAAAARIRADLAHFMATTEVPSPRRLPHHYRSAELGDLWTEGEGESLVFRFSSICCPMRVRHEADGSLSYVTAHPVLRGFAFAAPSASNAGVLVIREGQHEYRLTATQAGPASTEE